MTGIEALQVPQAAPRAKIPGAMTTKVVVRLLRRLDDAEWNARKSDQSAGRCFMNEGALFKLPPLAGCRQS
jgi:hypothetical protein